MRHFLFPKPDYMFTWKRDEEIKNEAASAATLFDSDPLRVRPDRQVGAIPLAT